MIKFFYIGICILFTTLPLKASDFYDEGQEAYKNLNYSKAIELYLKAASLGDVRAINNIGSMYEKGEGFAKNNAEAINWYNKAAEQGYALAQVNLGFMYENGNGVIKDDKQAASWYLKAAEQGLDLGQFNLGVMFENGKGVKQDYEKAILWYKKAANQNYKLSQFNLGIMYANGRGVKVDDKEAFYWFKKSASQGYARAQLILGIMYEKGQGISQDDSEARSWYQKAAIQGEPLAQKKLKYSREDIELLSKVSKIYNEFNLPSRKHNKYCEKADDKYLEYIMLDEIAAFGNEDFRSYLNDFIDKNSISSLKNLPRSLQQIYYINRLEPELSHIVIKKIKNAATYKEYTLFNENYTQANKNGNFINFLRNNFSELESNLNSSICLGYLINFEIKNEKFKTISDMVAMELIIEYKNKSERLYNDITDEIERLNKELIER